MTISTSPSRAPSRWLAGLLSALFPGLGQAYQRRSRRALLFLLPSAVLLTVFLVAFLADPRTFFLRLLDPTLLLGLLGLQVVVLAWRLLALGDALSDRRLPRLRGRDAGPLALLLAFVLLPQLYLGYATLLVRGTSMAIFQPGPTDEISGEPLPTDPVGPPPDWTNGERVTFLLLGVDSGPGRSHALTDTIIVASLDPTAGTVSLLSVPRDLVDVPLPNGTTFRPKINSLVSYVGRNPKDPAFAYARGSGVRALAGALDALLGIDINYYARVNLGGFVKLVDAVGGVDVHATTALSAPGYRDYGVNGFVIAPGIHHLDGGEALAYARIRKAAGENDFTRAARQQEVLVALRDRVVAGGFLGDLPAFLVAVGQTLQTDVPVDRLPRLAELAGAVGRDDVYRAVIEPPLVRYSSTPDPRGSILIPQLKAIRALAAALFTPPGVVPVVPTLR